MADILSTELPEGLKEYESCLDDLQYTEQLLARLLKLPEQGLHGDFARFQAAMAAVQRAEETARNARENARKEAHRIWGFAKANWTIAELQTATGYDDE